MGIVAIPSIADLLHLEDGFRGRDAEGGLLFYLNLGAVQIDALLDAKTKDPVTKWITTHIRDTMDIILKDGHPASIVCNMKNFSWRQHTHKTLLKVIDEALQPYECTAIRRVTLQHPPTMLKVAWKLVRPWTSAELRTLIETSNKEVL